MTSPFYSQLLVLFYFIYVRRRKKKKSELLASVFIPTNPPSSPLLFFVKKKKSKINYTSIVPVLFNFGSKFVWENQKLKDIESQIRTLQSQSIQTEERAASVLKPKKFSFKKSTDPSLPGTAATFQERRRTVPDELLANESVDPLNLKPHSQNLFIQPPAPLAPLHTLALSNLSSVVIDLRNFTSHLSILRLSQLHRTAVLAPSLSGSASLIQVSNSLLVSVCQQLRTYECHDLIFLLHTTTSPVIESSTQISLAPYPFELFPRTSSSAIIDPQSSQHGLAHDFEFPDGPPTNISPNLTILPTSPISNEDLTDLFQPQDLRTSADAHLPPGCFDLPEPARIRLMNL